jgi:hypothetical protein
VYRNYPSTGRLNKLSSEDSKAPAAEIEVTAGVIRIDLPEHACRYEVETGSDGVVLAVKLVAKRGGISRGDYTRAANVHDRLERLARRQHGMREFVDGSGQRWAQRWAERGLDGPPPTITFFERPQDGPRVGPPPRRRGRPTTRGTAFYKRVGDAARAVEEAADPSRSNAEALRDMVAEWDDVPTDVGESTVKFWLHKARGLGHYEGPRARRKHAQTSTDEKGTAS